MQPAIDNLFDEMLKWPGKYRSYFALVQPLWAAKAVPLRLSASEQEGNLENEVLRKRLDAGLCINRHKWSNKSVPSIQTMVWEGQKKGHDTTPRSQNAEQLQEHVWLRCSRKPQSFKTYDSSEFGVWSSYTVREAYKPLNLRKTTLRKHSESHVIS